MKKIVSETIDGSIKDIIQLKTLDASLEYSQMFDALEDCPQEFQSKLIGALNSLGETMQVSPVDTFNKVLCKSDEGEDVQKKMYNWWRAVFEILSECKIPDDKVEEYNQKVDDLMAEILKAGDGQASEEEPIVSEEYEPASLEDEDQMLENMEFAIQQIGEIANKVKELVNFVNPYCGTEVNESMTTGKPKFKKGDIVRLVGNSPVGRGMHGRIVDIELDYPDWGYTVDGRSGLFFADEEDLELVSERFTEEENSMKNKMNEKGGDSDWVSLDNIIGMRVGENVDDAGEGFWKAMDDVDNLEKKGYWSGKFKVGDKVNWIDPEYDEITSGWTVVSAPDEEDAEELPPEEAMYTIVNDDGSEAEVLGSELRPIEMTNEETLENELKKGDDGWTTIGQPVSEANVVVDANTVWDVLDLLDDTDANNNLTDLINSHLRTEDEIMDAIDSYVETNWHGKVKKQELNKLFTDWMYVIVDDLGLDVDRYRENGEFVDEGKPTSVELESDDMKSGWEKLDAVEFCDWMMDYSGTFTAASGIRIENATPKGDDEIAIDLSYAKKNADIGKFVDSLLRKVANWQFDGKIEPERDEDGSWHCEIKLNKSDGDSSVKLERTDDQKPEEVKSQDKTFNQDGENKTLVTGEEKKEMSDAEAATIMGGASDTDIDAADIGVSSHEVADPYKKPVCEMTIEQEVDNPWNLAEMLWGHGKENLEELLRSGVVSEDYVMQMLEEMELRNLTNINDAFAYDFESMLDTFGCDPEAWSQHLKIVKKGDYDDEDEDGEPVDEAKKKGADDPEAQKIEDAIPVDDKDGFIKIEKDGRYGTSARVAYFAPGSQPEIQHAASELRKSLPEYQIYTSDNVILLLPKKNGK